VVGAGVAGISAAVSAKRAGAEVILIERGKFSGSKNVFGGSVYAHALLQIFPDFKKNAPIDSIVNEHKFAILGEKDSTVISYHNEDIEEAYSVERGKFDRWMAECAQKEGVILVEETVVRELISDGKKITGVRTELEDYFCDTVIIADGVNSILTEQIGLRGKIQPQDVALSVKEVHKIDPSKVRAGTVWHVFGGPMLEMTGLGFIYVNKKTVSMGIGVALDDLMKHGKKPYEILDELKEHPTVAPLIAGSELVEYSAHLIPEGGYKKMPRLWTPGVLVVGDAAMMVNNVHWEGTNLAMISGKIAGEAAASGNLKNYEKELKKSFITKDLYTYREVMDVIHKHSKDFLGYYPRKINEFFKMFTSVDGVPKRKKYHIFIVSLFKRMKDIPAFLKLGWSIFVK
jgi:electron transfer flavoprotein-quinone oxidoreductase